VTAPRGGEILVVEDNEASADMLRRRLERRGFAVVCVGDGHRALTVADERQPDLILMDLSMPELDGWQTTRLLKANPRTAPIPVIALTAHAFVTDRQRSIDAGCEDFETKPLNFDLLIAKIDAVLTRRAQHA
jgi:two-component system cell cycle response regulator DivK